MANINKVFVTTALKTHARDEAERLQRTLQSPALGEKNNVHLNYLNTMPDAFEALLKSYMPYFLGKYICPRCYIWQHKSEVLEIEPAETELLYTCVDCSFMVALKTVVDDQVSADQPKPTS